LGMLVCCWERWKGRANAKEVVEKRVAGISGLNATVSAKLAGKKTVL
nr:hypothetical protein [Tanacetum cinerariifolium]